MNISVAGAKRMVTDSFQWCLVTRSSTHKLKYRKLHLNMRKNFFTLRVAEHQSRLPREAMESASPDVSLLDGHIACVL